MGTIIDLFFSGVYRKLAIASIVCVIFLGLALSIQTYRLSAAREEIAYLKSENRKLDIQLKTSIIALQSSGVQEEILKKHGNKISEACKEIIRSMQVDMEGEEN